MEGNMVARFLIKIQNSDGTVILSFRHFVYKTEHQAFKKISIKAKIGIAGILNIQIGVGVPLKCSKISFVNESFYFIQHSHHYELIGRIIGFFRQSFQQVIFLFKFLNFPFLFEAAYFLPLLQHTRRIFLKYEFFFNIK